MRKAPQNIGIATQRVPPARRIAQPATQRDLKGNDRVLLGLETAELELTPPILIPPSRVRYFAMSRFKPMTAAPRMQVLFSFKAISMSSMLPIFSSQTATGLFNVDWSLAFSLLNELSMAIW